MWFQGAVELPHLQSVLFIDGISLACEGRFDSDY